MHRKRFPSHKQVPTITLRQQPILSPVTPHQKPLCLTHGCDHTVITSCKRSRTQQRQRVVMCVAAVCATWIRSLPVIFVLFASVCEVCVWMDGGRYTSLLNDTKR